jgi:uncharacterized protein (DUF697 family)
MATARKTTAKDQASESTSPTPQPDVQETASLETAAAASTSSPEGVNRLLRYHVWTAMGIGLIPVPIADLVALTGVQVNLLRMLAKRYHVPFRKGLVRNIVSSLIGGFIPVATTPIVVSSVVKAVPAIGQTAGVVTMPVIAGATTYALGKVFIQHFASGGTFLTFDPEKVKEYYAEMFKEGQDVAENLKSGK